MQMLQCTVVTILKQGEQN